MKLLGLHPEWAIFKDMWRVTMIFYVTMVKINDGH